MKNTASGEKASGVRSFWAYALHLLADQRGEVNPGAQEDESGEWDVTGGEEMPAVVTPQEDASSTDAVSTEGKPESSAETLKPEEEATPEEPGTDELPPFHEHPRWKEMVQERDDLKGQLENVRTENDGKLEGLGKQLEFYQQQLNTLHQQLAGQPTGAQPTGEQPSSVPTQTPQPAAPAAEPTPLGVEIPGLPPEAQLNRWENQAHQGQYMDARIGQHLDHRLASVSQDVETKLNHQLETIISPAIQKLGARLANIQEHITKGQHEDYKDVVDGVMDEIFHRNPADGKLLGIKNQALMSYFQKEDNPYAAMYSYGAMKRAPEAIKEGVQKGTQKVVQKLVSRPKAATQVTGKASGKDQVDLGWETSEEEAEGILAKQGLIPS